MKTTFLNSEKTREQLTVRNKLLEEQVRELKKEIGRKNERQTAFNGQDGVNTISRSSVIVSIVTVFLKIKIMEKYSNYRIR